MIVLQEMNDVIHTGGEVAADGLRIWTARDGLEANCSRDGDALIVESSGNPGCFGGWDVVFAQIEGGRYYNVGLSYEAEQMDSVLDGMPIFVFWLDEDGERIDYDYLMTRQPDESSGTVERLLRAPDSATQMALRFGVRWTTTGRARFWRPSVEAAEAPPQRTYRIAVAAGMPDDPKTVDDNLAFFADLAREAGEVNADLVLMPEVILSWRLGGDAAEHAREIPGPETDAFAAIAREHDMLVAFSMSEADGDLIYNTEVLIGPYGEIIGKYRKVHLAITEGWDGVTPGSELPVFDSPIGPLAMSICKDSSVLESARVPAMGGAEAMLLSIMGDHRAVDWRRPNTFSPDRGNVIMRARAIENHLWMVVARNTIEGSCIIAPSGDIVAYNHGAQRVITANCDFSERLRVWRGASFEDSTWAERRPHLYQ